MSNLIFDFAKLPIIDTRSQPPRITRSQRFLTSTTNQSSVGSSCRIRWLSTSFTKVSKSLPRMLSLSGISSKRDSARKFSEHSTHLHVFTNMSICYRFKIKIFAKHMHCRLMPLMLRTLTVDQPTLQMTALKSRRHDISSLTKHATPFKHGSVLWGWSRVSEAKQSESGLGNKPNISMRAVFASVIQNRSLKY